MFARKMARNQLNLMPVDEKLKKYDEKLKPLSKGSGIFIFSSASKMYNK